jgi:DNA-binding Lrp family transcriptional regulator
MLKVLNGYETEVYEKIIDMNEIKDAYRILGNYALFIVIQQEEERSINCAIETIKEIPGVISIWNLLLSKEDQPSRDSIIVSQVALPFCMGK